MNIQVHTNYGNGTRPRCHFDAYKAADGYYFIEICCLTLEIDAQDKPSLCPSDAFIRGFILALLLCTAAYLLGYLPTLNEVIT